MVHIISPDSFDTEISSGLVLVDFYADWCAPCQRMLPKLEQFEKTNNEVKIGKLNVDDGGNIAWRYGIMGIPTMILFKDGEVVEKVTGEQEISSLEELVKKYV